MRSIAIALLCTGLGLLGGYALGRTLEPPPPPESSTRPAPARTAPSPVRGMVCVRPDDAGADEACESLRPALSWCEGRLEQCESRGVFRRHDWPETTEVEHPEPWAEAVRSALDQCAIDIEFELVECTEYPCVAAIRPPSETGPGIGEELSEKFVAYRQGLQDQLAACTPLQSAFGGGDRIKDLAWLYPYDAPCEHGSEPMLVLSVLHADGPAWAMQDAGDLGEQLRWSYRRGEDVAAAWQCGAAPN